MKSVTIAFFCLFLAAVYCQTQNKNGNPTGEIGQPAFDEIIVESTLTVRGKSGSRSGKSLVNNSRPGEEPSAEALTGQEKPETVDGSSVALRRNRRVPARRFGDGGGGGEKQAKFFGSSSSSAHASSNAFNFNGPFGGFGASASQSATFAQNFGPNGFRGSSGQSASQTYSLPNGSKINVAFSNSFGFSNDRIPSFSNSHAISITSSDGKVHTVFG